MIGQSAMSLLYKCEDMHAIPRIHIKVLGMVACTSIPAPGEQVQENPGVYGPANLVKLGSSVLCLKIMLLLLLLQMRVWMTPGQ